MPTGNPIINIAITPSYANGFLFSWDVDPSFFEPGDWTFYVQQAETEEGPWSTISPPLINQFIWDQNEKRILPKDPILHFRILLQVGSKSYISNVISPYYSLPRREFLIVRDIIRQELLQQREMAGVCCDVWRKSVIGPKCTECVDFVTGEPLNGDCAFCFGTGRNPGYHGPYRIWATISALQRDKQMQNDQTGVREPYTHEARVVGTIRLKNDDVIVDTVSNERYFVDVVNHLMEIRRYPVVQSIIMNRIATSHPLYKLGV